MASIFMCIVLLFGIINHCPIAASVGNGTTSSAGSKKTIRVGVILDPESGIGNLARNSISMAFSDFYAAYPNYQTRLSFSVKTSARDAVVAASAGNKI